MLSSLRMALIFSLFFVFSKAKCDFIVRSQCSSALQSCISSLCSVLPSNSCSAIRIFGVGIVCVDLWLQIASSNHWSKPVCCRLHRWMTFNRSAGKTWRSYLYLSLIKAVCIMIIIAACNLLNNQAVLLDYPRHLISGVEKSWVLFLLSFWLCRRARWGWILGQGMLSIWIDSFCFWIWTILELDLVWGWNLFFAFWRDRDDWFMDACGCVFNGGWWDSTLRDIYRACILAHSPLPFGNLNDTFFLGYRRFLALGWDSRIWSWWNGV